MYVHVKTGCSCSKHLHVHAILASAHIETYSRFKDLVMDFFNFIPRNTFILYMYVQVNHSNTNVT